MKCRECGAPTRVLATREEAEGYVPKRTRECDNGHRFTTFEVDDSIEKTVVQHAIRPARIGSFVASSLMYRRNQEIMALALAGEKHASIAHLYGIADSTVSTVLRRLGVPSTHSARRRAARPNFTRAG